MAATAATDTHPVLALTDEDNLLVRVEDALRLLAPVEIVASTDPLRLIEAHLCRHARLLILDVDLLGDQAARLAHIARQIEPACRLLLLAAPPALPLCAGLLPLGCVSYLVKPVCARTAAQYIAAGVRPRKLEIPNPKS